MGFSDCCPNLMPVCNDESNTCEVYQDLKRFFESAVLGNEGVDFEARFALFCISGGLGEFGVEEGS